MTIANMSTNLNIIAALADKPNATDGLTAAQLKAKFDEGPNALKSYINNTMVPAINAAWTDSNNPVNIVGANGYQKLNNGMVFQFGVISSQNPGSVLTTAFPTVYPIQCLTVIAIVASSAAAAISIVGYSESGFQSIHNAASASPVLWFSIGR